MHVTGILMARISPSRQLAFEVLEAVEKGSYASDTLRHRSRMLDSRDAALAAQIVFGCLRFRAQLDYLIFRYFGRTAEQLDIPVAIALRTGIFQLRYLERIPRHAAVDESVELVKRRARSAAGLANAVLRKVNRDLVSWPGLATQLSCPEWLLARWERHFGPDQAQRIAEAALKEPVAYIRVPPGADPPAGSVVERTDVRGCFRLLSPVKPGMRLHDISSQAILPLLNLQPGHTYLDLCAAPGNKTLQALETAVRLAVACDISPRRIRDIPPVCPRVVLDAARPLPLRAHFDRIFIDAPCSGTGTLSRNPEIKWRVQERDFARFGEIQSRIVLEGLRVLAPQGKLLYATCSLECEENEDVIAAVLQLRPDFHLESESWRLPGREEGDGFYAAVLAPRNYPAHDRIKGITKER
jgi:16S rRNA (cytosine967-C5)-methyltransferase